MVRTGGPTALVPTGRQMKSYACLRSLHRRGIEPLVASELDRIPHYASRFCSQRVHLPAPPTELDDYADALLALAARPEVETIYPVREYDTYLLARDAAAFEPHVSTVVPSFDSLRRAHDRLGLAREAADAGVPFARTRRLSDVDAWDANLVVKARYNLLTSDYVDGYPAGRAEEVKGVISVVPGDDPDVDAIRAAMRHEPIVQDFVPQARKHLYTALWADGEPLVTYQHRQIRQNSWVGGGGVYRESVHSAAVDDVATRLLSHLDWHGFVCIEYLLDRETGEWKFLEINPRIWQSMPEAVMAGVDFPYYYWLLAHGTPSLVESTYEDGVRCHNAYGEVAHLLSILRDDSPFIERPSFAWTLLETVASWVRYPRFEFIRPDDPGLFLSAMRETLSSGVTPDREYAVGTDRLRGVRGAADADRDGEVPRVEP